MDSLDDSKLSSKLGFFKYLFNFDDTTKAELLNIVQYALIAFIPIVSLNKAMQKFVPEAEEEKSSVELLAEVLIQIIVMFISLFYINRIVTYLPTYSGTKYPEYSAIFNILSVLSITMSLQTKLGEKVGILFDRVTELWEGKSDDKKKKGKGKGNVKTSQPISGQNQNQQLPPPAMGNSLYGGMSQGSTSISSLPTDQSPQTSDYNGMYRNDNTPLVAAATPGGGDPYGSMIMAANEVLGGSAFGANW